MLYSLLCGDDISCVQAIPTSFSQYVCVCGRVCLPTSTLSTTFTSQGSPDLASDFRLKESVDGTVSFESVIQSGSYVGIKGPAGFQTKLYIFLVVTMDTLQHYNCVLENSIKKLLCVSLFLCCFLVAALACV